MNSEIQRGLAGQRGLIRTNWENLLRLERAISPLANPDTLVYMLDTTLDEIFTSLDLHSPRRHPCREPEPQCPCGCNPLLAYFKAGRQALREALVVVQAATPPLTSSERDEALTCLDQVFGHIARREIESFCAVCQFRTTTNVTTTTAHFPQCTARP